MKERKAENAGPALYSHWMKEVHKRAPKALHQMTKALKDYTDGKATEAPDLKVREQVMLNAKSIRAK